MIQFLIKSENKDDPTPAPVKKKNQTMKRKQSTTTYSKLVSHITTWELANTKIMVHNFAVLYFYVTYLRIVLGRAYVLLA